MKTSYTYAVRKGALHVKLALLMLICCFLCSCSAKKFVSSVATVVDTDVCGTIWKRPAIEYMAGNKRILVAGPGIKYLSPGEKFKVYYDCNNPYRNTLVTDSPLFLPEESVGCTTGKIVKCSTGSNTKITFEYEVNGKSYRKIQVFDGFYSLQKSASFEVDYWTENPQRSILTLNPVSQN
jgi:hypothetical protein